MSTTKNGRLMYVGMSVRILSPNAMTMKLSVTTDTRRIVVAASWPFVVTRVR